MDNPREPTRAMVKRSFKMDAVVHIARILE
jgi:hypothetical protein